jgi:hypothetical protein
MSLWSSSQICSAFNLSAPELGPHTAGEKVFSCSTGPALLIRNPYTGTTLNAAQSKEVDIAMLLAELAKKTSDRGSQVDIQGDTTLQPNLP